MIGSRQKLAEELIDRFKAMLETGRLKQGDKLPNQHEFAAQMGVSRTVLREAFRTLASMGVIEQRPKLGTIIRDPAALIYTERFAESLLDQPKAAADLIMARGLIEIETARLAAESAAEEQIQKMDRLIRDMADPAERSNVAGQVKANTAFHFLIAQASQNPFLVNLLAGIRSQVEEWMEHAVLSTPGLPERSLAQHRRIYLSIKSHTPAEAKAAMEEHMDDIRKRIGCYQAQRMNKRPGLNRD